MLFGHDHHSHQQKTGPCYLHHRQSLMQKEGGKDDSDRGIDITHETRDSGFYMFLSSIGTDEIACSEDAAY